MDNIKKTGSPDSKTINLGEDYEIAYWTMNLALAKNNWLTQLQQGASQQRLSENI